MERGDLDATGQQLGHDRVHLLRCEDEITHDHRGVAHLLECEPAAECKARFEFDPVERRLDVGSR